MTTIATANSSAYSAVASLLSSSASNAPDDLQIGQGATSDQAASSSGDPKDSVDLSDHAKQVLARAQNEQLAADKLDQLLQFLRGKDAGSANATGDGHALGQQTKQSDARPTLYADQVGKPGQEDDIDGQFQGAQIFINGAGQVSTVRDLIDLKLIHDHTRADGTFESYSVSINDLYSGPTSPEETQLYLQRFGGGFDEEANVSAANPDIPASQKAEAQALQQAYHSGTMQVLNAADIPGLNYHNTVTFSGGQGGFTNGDSYSYDRNASIFSDPTTYYRVTGEGTVLAWPKASDST